MTQPIDPTDPVWLADNLDKIKSPRQMRDQVIKRWRVTLPECEETDQAVDIGKKLVGEVRKRAWKQNPDAFRALVLEAIRNIKLAKQKGAEMAAQQAAADAAVTPPPSPTP